MRRNRSSYSWFLFIFGLYSFMTIGKAIADNDNLDKSRSLFDNLLGWNFFSLKGTAPNAPNPEKLSSEYEWRTEKIISDRGYPVEVHELETRDGYILEIHRIPGTNPHKRSVLVVHGILVYSSSWVITSANDSLAFMLANAGYDVWLANLRGTPHCRRHKTLDPNSAKFWDFGMEETAVNDLPAMIDYILNTTHHQEIYYIGHSMGTTLGFILLSTMLEYNNKIHIFIAEAPVAYLHHLDGAILNILLQIVTVLADLLNVVNIHTFPPLAMDMFAYKFCTNSWSACIEALDMFNGLNLKEWNKEDMLRLMYHYGKPNSIRVFKHFSQIYQSRNFQRYDWGFFSNLATYGQKSPPEYNLTSIAVPTVFYCGLNDQLSRMGDVNILSQGLPNHLETYIIEDRNWTHLDDLIACNVSSEVNSHIIGMLDKFHQIT